MLFSKKVFKHSLDNTKEEIFQAVEGFIHNANSLQSRSGNQLPFTSVNYGTCTLEEGRMITKALLQNSINGNGKYHRTSIFPCGIFQYMKGINDKPGTPNYDLYRLALQSTSKRLYPNYVDCEWSGNKGYDRNNPDTYASTMGALMGDERLYIKINNDTPIELTIGELYEYCKGKELFNYNISFLNYNDVSLYKEFNDNCIELVDKRPSFKQDHSKLPDLILLTDKDIKVLDKDNKWVKLKSIFKNDKDNSPMMMCIQYILNNKEYCLSCTEDHPLWNGKDFIRADELTLKDKLYRIDNLQLDIIKVSYYNQKCDSYDIETESGTFIGSNVIMHNCRTFIGYDINGLGYSKIGRGNAAPVTIILPTLVMEADRNVDKFFEILDKTLDEAKDMLLERYYWICSQSPESAQFMYENGSIAGYIPEEGIESAMKHMTLALGLLGVAETLILLIGKDQTTDEGMELAKRILQVFKDKAIQFKNDHRLNFSVYYTPAESLVYTAMKKFQEKYGIIKDVSDKKFFTNSIHVPVYKQVSPFEKIDIESQLTGYSSAGCITYVELNADVQKNIDALEELVNYAMDKDIPYFAINVPSDCCEDCGYQGYIENNCPKCGSSNIERLRRVTGYLTADYRTAFNEGKVEEVEKRVKHVDNISLLESDDIIND